VKADDAVTDEEPRNDEGMETDEQDAVDGDKYGVAAGKTHAVLQKGMKDWKKILEETKRS